MQDQTPEIDWRGSEGGLISPAALQLLKQRDQLGVLKAGMLSPASILECAMAKAEAEGPEAGMAMLEYWAKHCAPAPPKDYVALADEWFEHLIRTKSLGDYELEYCRGWLLCESPPPWCRRTAMEGYLAGLSDRKRCA